MKYRYVLPVAVLIAYVVACSKKDSPVPVTPPPVTTPTDSPYVASDFAPHTASLSDAHTITLVDNKKAGQSIALDKWKLVLVSDKKDTIKGNLAVVNDKVTATFPDSLVKVGKYGVVLFNMGTTVTSKIFDSAYSVTAPTVTLDKIKDTLVTGQTYLLTGKYIGKRADSTVISLVNQDNAAATSLTITKYGADSVWITIPETQASGKYKIRCKAWGQTAETTVFTVAEPNPTVTSLSACNPFAGGEIGLDCYHCSTIQDNITINIDMGGGMESKLSISSFGYNPSEPSHVRITARVPDGFGGGTYPVIVSTAGKKDATINTTFQNARYPAIQSLDKASYSASQDQVIELRGSDLGVSQYGGSCTKTGHVEIFPSSLNDPDVRPLYLNATFNAQGNPQVTVPANSFPAGTYSMLFWMNSDDLLAARTQTTIQVSFVK
ncbi:hypothetical protein [Deminuibacter soli]|uniref:IPT/TIG domain-containing protein n=1 Tax=Deminuibacter soli TaxID=2291815 RepID=A0A3E1NJQ9_9BACT|nr:hypothetical protein [Deminuibacter soli]RFM28176.1 hypothetical protein DXN05_11685 [Deminuibacter soli]